MRKKHDYDKILFRLLGIIKKLNSGEEVTKKELSLEYNVSEKTIQKDLNQRLGNIFPIERKNGKYSFKEGYRLDKQMDPESILVIDILKGISKSFGDYFKEKSEKIFNNIAKADENFLLSKMVVEDLSLYTELVQILQEAIEKRVEIELYYKEKRVLQPYKITIFEGFWYLYAKDLKDGRFKTFYIKDMKNLVLTDRVFEVDKEKMSKLENAVNIWFEPDNDLFEVVLHANANIAKYFMRKSFFKTQKILEKRDDGSLVFSIQTTSKTAILFEVKKWIPDLIIISPEHLVKDFVSLLGESARAYTCNDN
jgi:predicted DNA-binding transcriptional regulator YafY